MCLRFEDHCRTYHSFAIRKWWVHGSPRKADGQCFGVLRLWRQLQALYSIDTTRDRGHACDHRRIPQLFCGRWLRSGVPTPQRRPWPRQCRSFYERSCCYFGSMAAVGGAYLRDKNTCARAGNVGGAYTRRGAYMRDATVTFNLKRSSLESRTKVLSW